MLLGGFEIPLWAVLGVPATALFYLYNTRTFDTFKKTGIPGPKPYPVLGTMMELFKHGHIIKEDIAFAKKYGKFVGLFSGSTPMLVTTDAEWLKEAWIKHFRVFTNRRRLRFGGSFDHGLFSIEGDHWRHVRQKLSPEFSSGKLKKMMPAILKCENRFLEILKQLKGEPIDIRMYSMRLTLDVISNTAFGIDAETQTKITDNPFLENACKMIDGVETKSTTSFLEKARMASIFMLILLAPDWFVSFMHKYFNMGLLDADVSNYFDSLTESLIEERKSSDGADFLQTLANNLAEAPASDPDTSINHLGKAWTKKGLTKIEVMGNTVLFLSAGFQTTADTMSMLLYELAMNPDAQNKLYEEIVSVCDTEEITVEQISQLKYLEYCINESMRLYPQGFRLDRTATEDIEIRGIKVNKGTSVGAAVYAIHRSDDYFENPDEFQPERFAPENFTERHAAAFMPFGVGNRLCIGNRLALLEMKVTVAVVLKQFSIEKTSATPPRPLQFRGAVSLTPDKDMIVSFVERS